MGSSHQRILVEAWGSLGRAEGSLVLLLFFLLLLAGELGGKGSVLQLQARQRVFDA